MIKLLRICFTAVTRIEVAAQASAADSSYIVHVVELNYR